MRDVVQFTITDLQARVSDTVSVEWGGRDFNPEPLNIELDGTAGVRNSGVLDYTFRRAQAEFHVLLTFPEFASMLEALGVDPQLTQPVHAVIRSKGDVLSDHSFVLSGPCDLTQHPLLNEQEIRASVSPGT